MDTSHTPRLIPLGGEAHAVARQFAAPFNALSESKSRKVYHNTLAVFAVYTYLKWLQVNIDLTQGDSWDFVARTISDPADLVFPRKGKLECRPVLPGETKVYIPPEAESDRIGYIAVLLNEPILNEAQLLGFVATAELDENQEIELAALEPFEALLDVVFPEVDQATANSEVAATTTSVPPRLSHWLTNIFTNEWQPFESLLSAEAIRFYATRGREILEGQSTTTEGAGAGVRRGKLINLGIKILEYPLALVVRIRPTSNPTELDISVRLYPANGQYVLPKYVKLTVIEENGEVFQEIIARETDNWIQAAFFGKVGEKFFTEVSYAQESLTEEFII